MVTKLAAVVGPISSVLPVRLIKAVKSGPVVTIVRSVPTAEAVYTHPPALISSASPEATSDRVPVTVTS